MNTILHQIVRTLNRDNVVAGSGFMIGFMYEFKFNNKTLEKPLSTVLRAGFSGCMCYVGAGIINEFIPYPYKMIIPVMSLASCVYYKYKDIKN